MGRVEEVLKRVPRRCIEDIREYVEKIDRALDNLEKLEDKERMAWAFKALSNTTKLDIILLLAASEMPVCLISYILEKDQSLISHHLSDLKTAGLVKETVRGKFRVYKLQKDALLDLFNNIGSIVRG
ncbi:MAG: metalloregulator ArsR/SmtB family transcription factor [Candidatus Korarchaeota archaeon]|nr:metalloregulator ArsR/SmtB family transcription factor [Candidatus Korarchaeota archaeon]